MCGLGESEIKEFDTYKLEETMEMKLGIVGAKDNPKNEYGAYLSALTHIINYGREKLVKRVAREIIKSRLQKP